MIIYNRKPNLTNVVKNLGKTIERQDGIEKKLNHGKKMIATKLEEILSH
jgi:hypothetical protein